MARRDSSTLPERGRLAPSGTLDLAGRASGRPAGIPRPRPKARGASLRPTSRLPESTRDGPSAHLDLVRWGSARPFGLKPTCPKGDNPLKMAKHEWELERHLGGDGDFHSPLPDADTRSAT